MNSRAGQDDGHRWRFPSGPTSASFGTTIVERHRPLFGGRYQDGGTETERGRRDLVDPLLPGPVEEVAAHVERESGENYQRRLQKDR